MRNMWVKKNRKERNKKENKRREEKMREVERLKGRWKRRKEEKCSVLDFNLGFLLA